MFENTVCSICDLHIFFLSLISESRITFVLANQCYNYICVMKSRTYFALWFAKMLCQANHY